jgi:hypothetical protein
VAFERSETQQLQDFEVLGFVPQPNLHSIYQNRCSRKLPRENLLVLESTIAVISECLVVTNITTLSLNITAF